MKQPEIKPKAISKLYAFGKKRLIDLSLSENPLGCSPLVFSALKNMKMNFSEYPTPNGSLLKKALASKFGLNSKNFFIANGSESIISDIPRVFACPKDEVVIPQLTFPLFRVCSELAGLSVVVISMKEGLGIDLKVMPKSFSQKTKLVFVCNPNNPTGDVLSKESIIGLLNTLPESVILVVDEANIEFGGESLIGEINQRKNLIVLRTFSKGFGLANLRIGFAAASKEIILRLEEETPVFQASGLSESLACVALSDSDFIDATKRFVAEQRGVLLRKLQGMGFTVFPSEANNLFVRLPEELSADIFLKEIKARDISLVMGSNFEGFDDSFFRVSVRNVKTNRKFLREMGEIVMRK